MQLFTTQQVIDMYVQSREIAREIFGSFLVALWQNILSFFPSLWDAVLAHDWGTVAVYLLVLFGSIVLFYRLVRKSFFMAIRSISNN